MYKDMIPVFRFVFIAIFVLAAMALRAQADSPIDADNAVRRTGVVLKAGAIDSSTVEVGTFAVVIHGQGERQPVSGEWESLATARGYIQAVNVESLTLGLEGDHGTKQIALNRIQTLVLIGSPKALERTSMRTSGRIARKAESPYLKLASRDSTQAEQGRLMLARERSGGMDKLASDRVQTLMVIDTGNSVSGASLDSTVEDRRNMSTGLRVAIKLITGTYVGFFGGSITSSYCEDGQELDCLGPALLGYWVGNAIGVSMIDVGGFDSPDPTILSVITTLGASLGGCAVGVIGSIWLTTGYEDAFPSIVIVPVVGATLASEWWRKFSADRRLSIGLAPNRRGTLSAAVSLCF